MRLDVEDSIAAVATAAGSALRGVIRISGPDCLNLLDRMFTQQNIVAKNARSFEVLELKQSLTIQSSIWLDSRTAVDAILLIWPGKQSFTRQPSVEIHTLGAEPVLQKILQLVFEAGARPAEPGEFTLRAFLSGRLDLTQAEAVLGLIDAKNQQQFQTSLRQVAGGIGGPITEVRDELIGILAELEAGLDFVEEDIEFVTNEQIVNSLRKCIRQITKTVEQIQDRKSSAEVLTVVLAGRPNAGKSSLFNLLTGQSAIVSSQPGTTRDYLHAELQMGKQKLRLVDTAGLEAIKQDSDSQAIGEQMLFQSESQIGGADILLLCIEAKHDFNDDESRMLERHSGSTIVVATKIDQCGDLHFQSDEISSKIVRTSATEGLGIEALLAAIQELALKVGDSDSTESATTARIERNLSEVQTSIGLALEAAELGSGEEIVAAEIRGGLEHLGMIVGTIYNDDILDQVFSRFCIGK